MKKLLIIDDDTELCNLLCEYFSAENFICQTANDGCEGLDVAQNGNFDLITLDVMLPGIDGISLLKKLRKKVDTPVVMLTARGEEEDRVGGLELGADDYLAKPFSPRELLARIKAILRRIDKKSSGMKDQEECGRIKVGDVVVDKKARAVWQNSQPISLTEVEFNLLDLLLNNAGQVVDRQELARASLGRRLDY
ncbi:MAG: response regulator transcription factor, partial [Candidatus Rifleibacteriota bacterium]